jgi:hypothetical protein
MDEHGAPRRLERREQRREALEAAGRRERVRGQLEPDRPGVERVLQRAGAFRRGPGAKRRRQLERALEPGIGQRARLRLRQPVDSQGRRRGDEDEIESLRERLLRACGRVVRGGVDAVRRLAVELERPAVQPRRVTAGTQGAQERSGPQVLVQVDGHGKGGLNRFTESVH